MENTNTVIVQGITERMTTYSSLKLFDSGVGVGLVCDNSTGRAAMATTSWSRRLRRD